MQNRLFRRDRRLGRGNQRRLATAAKTKDDSHAKSLIGLRLLDFGFPEPHALGQPVAICGTGQQAQKEIGVTRLVSSQPARDNCGLALTGRR